MPPDFLGHGARIDEENQVSCLGCYPLQNSCAASTDVLGWCGLRQGKQAPDLARGAKLTPTCFFTGVLCGLEPIRISRHSGFGAPPAKLVTCDFHRFDLWPWSWLHIRPPLTLTTHWKIPRALWPACSVKMDLKRNQTPWIGCAPCKFPPAPS